MVDLAENILQSIVYDALITVSREEDFSELFASKLLENFEEMFLLLLHRR